MIFYDRRELILSLYFVFPKWLPPGEAHFLGKPSRLTREKENSHQLGFATSKAHKRETQGKHFDLVFREITSCFRHLEKPIKTKENKIKPFVFICFYWFCSVFLDGESK
jgi:hypothetical protein